LIGGIPFAYYGAEVVIMLRMSVAEYKAYIAKKHSPKYHNKKVYVYEDGFVFHKKCKGHGTCMVFDSQKEFARYKQLQLLERAGVISELARQVPFVILEAFISEDGTKHKPIVYYADFLYKEGGRVVVEDVKGIDKKTGKVICTETFKLKWKLLQAKYPDKVFKVY